MLSTIQCCQAENKNVPILNWMSPFDRKGRWNLHSQLKLSVPPSINFTKYIGWSALYTSDDNMQISCIQIEVALGKNPLFEDITWLFLLEMSFNGQWSRNGLCRFYNSAHPLLLYWNIEMGPIAALKILPLFVMYALRIFG